MRGRDYWAYHRATGPLMRLYIHIKKKKRSATAGPLLTGPPGKLPVLPMPNPPLATDITMGLMQEHFPPNISLILSFSHIFCKVSYEHATSDSTNVLNFGKSV